MTRLSRPLRWMVVAATGLVLIVGAIAISPALEARPHEQTYPPDQCSNCPAPYIGPNGGVCQPAGCVRTNGPCILGGDCY